MKYTPELLTEKLDKHLKWLKGEEGGERLVLEADANLSYADLRSANLSYADLRSANLRYANLRSANLSYANLSYANLSYANLRSANLSYANLSYANLSYANLRSADLRSADLRSADLRYAENFDPLTAIGFNFAVCPEEGAFIGFKQVCYAEGRNKFNAILTLQIPAKAKRISTYISRKCRTNEAKVLRAETMDGQPLKDIEFFSKHDANFTYEVGKTAKVPDYNGNVHDECATGIHFFITKKEALEY